MSSKEIELEELVREDDLDNNFDEDLMMYEEDEDNEVYPSSKKNTFSRNPFSVQTWREFFGYKCVIGYIIILAIVLIPIFIIFSFAGGYGTGYALKPDPNYHFYFRDPVKLNRSDPTQTEVLLTKEFQIKVDKDLFTNRAEGVDQYLEIFNNVTGFGLRLEDAEITLFEEIQYHSSDCGTKYSELRVRRFTGGDLANTSQIDINKDMGHDMKAALAVDIRPNIQYEGNSSQKIEQDIHACYHKYGRKTKIKGLQNHLSIHFCEEIFDFFPTAFDKDPSPGTTVLRAKSKAFWHEIAWTGYSYYDTTKYKVDFTTVYKSLRDSQKGDVYPEAGEFSFRIYSLDKGLGDWDKNAILQFGEYYEKLIVLLHDRTLPCK